jgi:ABC-type Na+ efflux pump permease subunit
LEKSQRGDVAALDALSDITATVEVTVRRISVDDDLAGIRDQVQSGELLALVEVPAILLESDPPTDADILLLVPSNSPAKTTALFARIARQATVVARVERTGTDLAKATALVREPQAQTARLTSTGTKAKENLELRFLIPGGFMMLMWIAAFTSANQLLTTTIEEKSSKVIEVLLSATSPLELLAGKILGQGFVSLLMLSTYGVAGIAGLAFLTMLDIVPLSSLILFFIWFLLAYFMVASIMAAVGSAVSDLREAQSLVQPAMIVMMIPLFLWLPISENPTGWLATVTSFVPPIGPFVMVLRTTGAVEPIPLWQISLALAVNGFSTIALVWIASRVFRIGVLMQGKPPTPMELLRWARAR